MNGDHRIADGNGFRLTKSFVIRCIIVPQSLSVSDIDYENLIESWDLDSVGEMANMNHPILLSYLFLFPLTFS